MIHHTHKQRAEGARLARIARVSVGYRWRTDGSESGAKIGNNVRLEAGCIVLGPVTIGDGATIGAGAVVLDDIPAGAVAVGNPARVVKYREVS